MIRTFFLFLFTLSLLTHASEPIPAPNGGNFGGASASVKQPHVVAELIPQSTLIEAGQPFDVILHLHMDPDWHTYWINPGDSGLATTIKWTLPPGFTAGPIQWPTPEKHAMGPLTTYGYGGDVYLVTTITPPATAASGDNKIQVKAVARWLVCQEECIPGKGEFTLDLHFFAKDTELDYKHFENSELVKAARARLPVPNTRWDVKAAYESMFNEDVLLMRFANKEGVPNPSVGKITFFPEQANVLKAFGNSYDFPTDGQQPQFFLSAPLQQNGEKPNEISGVLVSDIPLIGTATSVYVSSFSTQSKEDLKAMAQAGKVPVQPADAAKPSFASGTTTAPPFLIVVLGAAFIGGLILNLMPCVLPVLSLKVFSLMKHADDPRGAWKQGAAFTVGVVLSFWVLAGLLLFLKAAGNQLGWGFQMQSPGFVLGLIFLFFLLGLNLLGVFELGASLVGLDAKVTGKAHGLTSSFLNGALATLAATPCTAPFMGSSVGFAAQQPWYVALLIFTFLALGMAAPYLLLTIFPGALKFVPKPGAWMETFKQVMGFLLLATVIWLVSVYGSLAGQGSVPWLLALLLLISMAAWIYGRWGFSHALVFAAACGLLAFFLQSGPEPKWEPWSPEAVDKGLTDGRPVFVDFTADWCLSCKVNERVALNTEAVQKAFANKKVVMLKGDWTHADPAISETLQKYNRDGVPLYLLYSPKDKEKPQVLPEVLTPGIVIGAIDKLP